MSATRSPSRAASATRAVVRTLAVAAALFGCTDVLHSTSFADDCSSDPTSKGCADRPLATDDGDEALRRATRACAWLGACNGSLVGGEGDCFGRALAAFDARVAPALAPRGVAADRWALLATATSCDAVAAATGITAGNVTCAASGAEYTGCAGAVRILCPAAAVAGTPPVGFESCALAGKACTAPATEKALCTGTTGLACSGPPRCDGTQLIACDGARDRGRDCSLEGDGTCVPLGATAACLPKKGGIACTPGDVVCSADGRFADFCSGESVRVDCAPLGLHCRAGAVPAGATPLDVCTSGDDARDTCADGDRCDGAKLLACVHGATVSIDCGAVGLGACRSDGPGRAVCGL